MPTLHRVQVVVCFNSRTPGGVRPERYCKATISILFQFTHPGRGATDLHSPRSIARDVSIHAPREGCDVGGRYMDIVTRKFQFTHPGRGATDMYADLLDSLTVSIHAPREGCDSSGSTSGGITSVFQFTHPGRGATAHYGVDVPRGRGVSIHAPREGCDSEILILDDQPSMFQFTHPGRGATGSGAGFPPRELSFNSRTPGGVRRSTSWRRICAERFNSRTPGGVRQQNKQH